ncbi:MULTISPECIES: glycoside hydrolase family 32 protein [Streptomyces]|uniref:beta-fructofuranosidase n=1 Tax=Streptomyces koelreuteriae TaxID=2838015 RepID=A0ABX8G324_9ACTN|nr:MULTISPECIES: glycoside hydrolase family 32 protein [Streptomyces]QWB27950.1 glycoside hydrolase family 32 protein [Streptomyces koelreuteriae]UUA11057.1 glycoside hydrolase family 32 protein [Streptomyces koelreuteriae]UUA18663.1 glycoside hydrolase family 32 protein [Streptomyces sp. CRCS-T-1]
MSLTAPPQDPHAPRYRVRPPANWMNDPNGPFRWRGRHHLFYQHNPDAPVHANVHWGHASSPDLVRWEHHPVALAPTPGGPDEAGCWSGCLVDDDGVPTAVYTGVDRDHTGLGTICLARAADPDDETLAEWVPLPTPVVKGPPSGLDVAMFRDPFVFRHDGRRLALVGAGHADGTPSVLLYDCDDLTDWRFAGVLLDGRDPVARAAFGDRATGWECPQLYATRSGEWVLVVSLWDGHPWTTGYLTGRLDGDLRFTARTGGRLDHGRDFYAPAVLQEPDRALMWGWSWEAREQGEHDWAGVLTAPRVVDVHPDGALRVAPAPELHRLHAEEPFVTTPGRTALPAAYDLTVSARDRTTVGLLRSASGAELTVRLDPAEGTVTLDRSDWPRKETAEPVVVRVPPTEELTVRVLVDGSLYELFVGDRATVTERVYQRPGDTRELSVTPGAAVTGWALVPPTRG